MIIAMKVPGLHVLLGARQLNGGQITPLIPILHYHLNSTIKKMKNGEGTIILGEVLEVPQSGAKAVVQTEAIQMDAIMMENLIQILMEHAALDLMMR